MSDETDRMVKPIAGPAGDFDKVDTHAHPWLTPAPQLPTITGTETCDIVVIGAGISGCTAVQSATEAGAQVICVEKFGTWTAHGIDMCAVGSKLQHAKGVEIDKALVSRLIYQWGQSQANYFLIREFVEHSGEVMDHYIDMASRSGYDVALNDEMTARTDWDTLEDRFKQFKTAHKWVLPEGSDRKPGKWNAAYFVNMVYDDAVANGAVFEFDTTAQQLIRTRDGRVTSVIVEDADGFRRIDARRGVILATGGITDNREMLRCFCPITLRADRCDHFPVGANMGDGLVLAARVGAALSDCYPAPIIHPVNFAPLGPGINTSWLTVNRDGMRFCCEVGYEPIVTNARMNTPGNIAWAIFDSRYEENTRKQEPVKSHSILPGIDEAMREAVRDGQIVEGETLSELASRIGVPADALQRTVKRYNGFCEAGQDPDFGVPQRFLCSVEKGPFYACRINAWMLAVPYGLHVNQDSQVCDDEGNAIEGLFAVGNVQGDFFANSYPVTLPGTSNGRCITFGHLVGKALAQGTTIHGYEAGFVDE